MKRVMLVKWLWFILVNPIISGTTELQKSNDPPIGTKIIKKILESCYRDENSSNPIVIFGDFDEFIDESSIIRINNLLTVKDYEKHPLLDFKASNIVLTEDSVERLQSDLMALKNTQWWNHMAFFFIIGKEKRKCENFREILSTTWKMNIINSIYICPQSINTSLLYTSNPIANYAPDPWKRIEQLNDLNVFHQVFDPNNVCRNLNYDKTKFLNGYQIRALSFGSRSKIYVPESNDDEKSHEYHNKKCFGSIIRALNGSLMIEFIGNHTLMMNRLSSGTSDLSMHPHILQWPPGKKFLIPYEREQLIAMVKSNPEVSTLDKILHLWSTPVLIHAIIALIILSLILTMKNRDYTSGILDRVRLLTYTSIHTDSANYSFRIYFTTMLIFMIISNGVFQGKIAAFLTTRERVRPIETIDELIELGYKFYTYPGLKSYVEAVCQGCDVTQIPEGSYADYVLNSTLHASIISKKDYEEKYALFPVDHIKKPLREGFVNQKCRDNWPFHERFDVMMFRVVESGLFNFWKTEKSYEVMHKRWANDLELSSPRYRPVRLVKLDFAFQLLAVGLFLATIGLFLELRIANWSTSPGIVRN